MNRRYAEKTTVDAGRSRDQIESMLMRFGCDEVGCLTRRDSAVIGFRYRTVAFEIRVPMPDREAPEFQRTPARGTKRDPAAAFASWEQEVKRRWRSLHAIVKAKLIAIEDQVTTFEAEFLPYAVWADGQTTTEKLLPVMRHAMENKTALMLPPAAQKGN